MNYKRIIAIYIETSSRAKKYLSSVQPKLANFAKENGIKFVEIKLGNTQSSSADDFTNQKLDDRKHITGKLRDGDLVIACGGDGIVQSVFETVYLTNKDLIFAAIPLGNGNDFARAINSRKTDPIKIISQSVSDFYPLKVNASEHEIIPAAYITFGATTKLVEILNQDEVRKRRKLFAKLSPAASLPMKKIRELSRAISINDFPQFVRNDEIHEHDSLGFFNVSAARGILRISRKFLFAKNDFFFHLGTVSDKNLLRKILMAGQWSINFPGESTTNEYIKFDKSFDLIANIAGDNIKLKNVSEIKVKKSEKSVKILTSRKS